MSGKQNVEHERQIPVLPDPPVISDRPKVARLNWEFKNERVFSHLDWGAWRVIRRREYLHARAIPSPRAEHAEAAKTVLATYLQRSDQERLLDFIANLLPLAGIKCGTGIDTDDPSFAERQHNLAG